MTYILLLNPMTGRAENLEAVARSDDPDSLAAFLDREKVPPYKDGRWTKFFRQGGPLEWYNEPSPQCSFGEGVREVASRAAYVSRAATEAGQSWDREFGRLPEVDRLAEAATR